MNLLILSPFLYRINILLSYSLVLEELTTSPLNYSILLINLLILCFIWWPVLYHINILLSYSLAPFQELTTSPLNYSVHPTSKPCIFPSNYRSSSSLFYHLILHILLLHLYAGQTLHVALHTPHIGPLPPLLQLPSPSPL